MSLFSKISSFFHHSSSDRLIGYLRKKGVEIGNNCKFRVPLSAQIDVTRPYLIKIGNNVDMNANFKIYTHDWASLVFIAKYKQMVNSAGKVAVGDNVYFGADVTILRGVTIGDNCVIAAGSVVTHSIPSNSVAAGVPCRRICSIDDYFQKRISEALPEAVLVVKEFEKKYGRYPKEGELIEEKIFYSNKKSLLPKTFASYVEFIEYCKNLKEE